MRASLLLGFLLTISLRLKSGCFSHPEALVQIQLVAKAEVKV